MNFNKYLDGYRNTENELSEFIWNKCEKNLKTQEDIIANINTIEQWEIKKNEIKENMLKSIGYLNFIKTPLNSKITGVINKEKYIIKKIIFESHKDFYVTGNLYLPKNINKKVPAVLFLSGHNYDSKANKGLQLAAIELVLNKIAVFCIDPPGQGETENFINRDDISWGTKEHSYVGMACTLMGTNLIRYFIWNIIRAVDFLCEQEFIDKEKIGVAGNSGGGTQSSYAINLDDRIKVGAISCYISGRKQYLRTGQACDSEQNLYNCMKIGLDYSEFLTCSAPKPIIVLSQQYDFFPIEGAIKSVKKAKEIYKLYKQEKNIHMSIDQNTHGLTDKNRKQLVKWFVKHFTNKEYVSYNPYLYLEKKDTLNCTKSGQVLLEYKNAKTIVEIIYEQYQAIKERNEPLKERIMKVFKIKEIKNPLLERKISPFKYEKHTGTKIFWIAEANVSIGGIYINGKESNICTYILFNEGTKEMDKYKKEILIHLEKGDVFIFDTRGVGAFKASPINSTSYYEIHGTIARLVNDSLMAGTSYIEMQINDILQAFNLTNKKINIIAYNKQVLPCLIVNKISKKVNNLKTIDGIKTFEDIIKCEYKKIPEYEVFNMAKYFDIEELMI